MWRNRVPQAVAGERARQAGTVTVALKQRLDLALPERPRAASEERGLRLYRIALEKLPKQPVGRLKQGPFGPCPALQASNQNAVALEIDITSLQQSDLS